jgi:sialate O-acetylesterase
LSCFERPDNENNTLWAQTRDQQLKVSLSLPNTAMVVTDDIGDPGNIHPKDKSTVGSRMLLAAKKLAYGDKVIAEGPLYDRVKFKDGKAIVFFKNSNKGLIAKDKLKEFEICGCDGKYFPAYAEIKGSRVVLESPYVQNPVAVRYSWTNANTLSLYNSHGLPASPFRSNEDY